MVNWAASGNGLGIVALLDGEFLAINERWWLNQNSFLHDELDGHVVYFRDNQPTIGDAAADYPVNDGLTSLGLSEWRNSFHAGFVGDIAGYTGTVFSSTAAFPGVPMALATSEFLTEASILVRDSLDQRVAFGRTSLRELRLLYDGVSNVALRAWQDIVDSGDSRIIVRKFGFGSCGLCTSYFKTHRVAELGLLNATQLRAKCSDF